MKYKLLMNGYYFQGSAHKLTISEMNKIHKFKKEKGYKSWEQMYSDLPDIIENYDSENNTNYWILTTGIITPKLHFVLVDEDENIIWDSKYIDFSEIWDESSIYSYPEDVEINTKEINPYPNVESPNILLYNETLIGTIINYIIESDVVPNPKEFAFTSYYFETPNYDLELVDKLFYKGNELEKYFDFENYRTKDLKVEVFTLGVN
jgi:hypothetical protein